MTASEPGPSGPIDPPAGLRPTLSDPPHPVDPTRLRWHRRRRPLTRPRRSVRRHGRVHHRPPTGARRRLRRPVRAADRPPGPGVPGSTPRSSRTRPRSPRLLARDPAAVILSGGPASVYTPGAPALDPALFDAERPGPGDLLRLPWPWRRSSGGTVAHTGHSEFGRTEIEVTDAERPARRAAGAPPGVDVARRRGDRRRRPGFRVTATSDGATVAAFESTDHPFAGVQFHPEVAHSPFGTAGPGPVPAHDRRPGAGLDGGRGGQPNRSRPSGPGSGTPARAVRAVRRCRLRGGGGARPAGRRGSADVRLRGPRPAARR